MLENFINLFFRFQVPTFIDKVYFFFIWLFIWTAYFLIINIIIKPENHFKFLSKKHSNDIRNRVVSITHGLFSFFMTTYHLIRHNPQYNEQITDFQHFLIIMSVAYFSYDLIACMFYNLTDVGLYVHHLLVASGYFMDEFYGFGGTETLMGLFLAEISNSPMHVRKILRNLGLRYTKAHDTLEYFYFVSYIIARGVFIPIVCYNTMQSTNVCFYVKFVSVGLFIQSFYYVKEMTQILSKALKYFNERKKKNISYFWLSENPEVEKLSYYRKEARQKIF